MNDTLATQLAVLARPVIQGGCSGRGRVVSGEGQVVSDMPCFHFSVAQQRFQLAFETGGRKCSVRVTAAQKAGMAVLRDPVLPPGRGFYCWLCLWSFR
jgi:hypothetical protein